MSSPADSAVARRAYFSASIENLLNATVEEVLGGLSRDSEFSVEPTQRDAWVEQIAVLQKSLIGYEKRGKAYFEFVVPRLGKRIDVVLLIDHVIFVVEFKVGEVDFTRSGIDQVWDYALDLKNFHASSHAAAIAPLLVATRARNKLGAIATTKHDDGVLCPVLVSPESIAHCIEQVLLFCDGKVIDAFEWEQGRYKPTPTIVEAARALYSQHAVGDLASKSADKEDVDATTGAINALVMRAKNDSFKALCFVTGVPGAGKTLVGLNVATQHMDPNSDLHSVYLSGNGPLVAILREVLTRDKQKREHATGNKIRKGEARQAVEAFIQNVHHFRDDCLKDPGPPHEHVAIFDEAQRAWNREQTVSFMRRKKNRPDFGQSEPEFLISCMNRHRDWAVVVCLVGGGQEINTGEAGIGEWINALEREFPDWHVYVSSRLNDEEYAAGAALKALTTRKHLVLNDDLHLSVSMRSFRAEKLSLFVKLLLDRELQEATALLKEMDARYPVRLTRDLASAKVWLKEQARGNERYGMVVSSQAQRLKPHAIDVKSPMDPVHWFLDEKEDVRSSYYLEDVATEFHVQGLELDWSCVVWDGDFRYADNGWMSYSFVGSRWQHIRKEDRKSYLKNAYRVLLTRARQGMVIVVPHGDTEDGTRHPSYYDGTFNYLESLGLKPL